MEIYSLVYGVITSIHIIGFIIYLLISKFYFNKTITNRWVSYYLIVWFFVLLGIETYATLIYLTISDEIGLILGITLGELVGLFIAFCICDGIIFYLGKKIYNYTNRKQKSEEVN
jgi:hypothetical protein